MTSLAVIDHGAGNLVSMEQALVRVGAEPTRVDEAMDLDRFDGIVLPGVGATGSAMGTLRRTGLDRALLEHTRPMLAVCVGMQLLFDWSEEDDTRCLGIVPGRVTALDATPLPHMGWNDVSGDDPLLADDDAPFYFVHGFAPRPDDPGVVVGTTRYGGDEFSSVVRTGTTVGAQFHPERSGTAGLELLDRFVRSCREVSRAA